MYTVKLFEDRQEDHALWTDYVERHPDSTCDHSWEWRQIISQSFGFKPHYWGAFDGNRLVGILPLFQVPRGFGKFALVSIPFANYGGVCADSMEAASALLDHAKNLMDNLKCAHVKLLHKSPLSCEGLKSVNEQARYSMPITGSEKELSMKWGGHNRQKMNKSIKSGVTVSSSRDTGPMYALHLHKFRRLGTPCFPREYFDLILKNFGDRVLIHYAYYKNKAIAFNLIILFKKSMLNIMGGVSDQYFKIYPSYLLTWHEMQYAVKMGFNEIDKCRSRRNSGPAEHKLCLGFQEYPLGYQYLLSEQHAFSPRQHNDPKFQMAIRIWQKIPLGFTQMIGPKLVRYFA